jgi:hypothetical protein
LPTMTAGASLTSVNEPEHFRTYLLEPGHEAAVRDAFAAADATLIYSRHHWLLFDGEYAGRKELRDLVVAMADTPVRDWSTTQAGLLLCLVALRRSGVGLEQVDEELSVKSVRDVLVSRLKSYLEALGHPRPLDHLALIELADRVSKLRSQIERDYHRYSIIDGRRWFRQEGLISRRGTRCEPLPAEMIEALRPFAPDPPGSPGTAEYLAAATRRCLADRGRTVDVVDAMLECAVRDPLLRVDHATVTCVRGVLLECPAALSDSAQFFTRTAMAGGLDLGEFAEQLGHASEARLRATLRARMIKLKRKAVQNYYGEGCLAGEWIEKAADNMIFFHEDSHYRGHQTVGVSTGGRAAFSVAYSRGGVDHTLPPMMGDFRVVRLSHDPADRFTADGLVHVIRYSEWIRTIVQETFRAGGVLDTDDDGGAEPSS